MIRICRHIYNTGFWSLSEKAQLVWFYAAAQSDREGIVDIHLNVLPRLIGLNETESLKVLEELGSHNFYEDDNPPFLSKHEEDNWCVCKILLWKCRYCEVSWRECIPLEIRQMVLSEGRCAHCCSTENLEVDHIKPVSLGGSNDIWNLQCLCRTCNRSKLNRFIG